MSDRKNDRFADIAMTKSPLTNAELEVPAPPDLEEITLPLDGTPLGEFIPAAKMSRPEELKEELTRWKNRYAPFLENRVPPVEDFRRRTALTRFRWRIEEAEDRRRFGRVLNGEGSWEEVSIPHYGGPLGEAVTYYRCSLGMPDLAEGEEAYLCFKGADYKAHVFVNESYVGSHEGFFAPFEFRVTDHLREGENHLTVKLENDYIFGGNVNAGSRGERFEGYKLYAATGPGYDDPEMGWHHCPPGMGLYQDVSLEIRSRLHIHDIFVRPLPETQSAEVWVEVGYTGVEPRSVSLTLSLYGRNFQAVVFEDREYRPVTGLEVGLGDSFTEQKLKAQGVLDKPVALKMEKGINLLKIPVALPEPRLWEPETPWLYQIQVTLRDSQGAPLDSGERQFGMRSFVLRTDEEPRGMFYLNSRPLRLRGANTMGHEQQCVMKKDWEQLIEDLLLARICNMNFLRLTQRPVQPEVYDYCDRLGLMIQTDLPLFGVLKRDSFCEALRQTEEMERLIRSHPSCILVSYINEPFPNASNKPHRHLIRQELERFFACADAVVHLNNPDRVIKHVDGDYDPPSKSLPDNHCYTLWYNGHGLDAGELHRGGWLPVRRGWNYGCGEFGLEGLESQELMKRRYPPDWLPRSADQEEAWSPRQIIGAQTGIFHYHFYPTPKTVDQWVSRSQRWQARGVSMMTEAFRRDNRMVSFAVHLFIDAFPAGWMKTIMDCERNPKPAYFAYREALTPLMVNLRTDRFRCFSGDDPGMEVWVCNDTDRIPPEARLVYRVEVAGRTVASGEFQPRIPRCGSAFQGFLRPTLPEVSEAEGAVFRAALIDSAGAVLHDTAAEIKIFPPSAARSPRRCWTDGSQVAEETAAALNLERVESPSRAELILAGSWGSGSATAAEILAAVESGATLLLLNLPVGTYSVGSWRAEIRECGMMPVHFAAPAEGWFFPPAWTGRIFGFGMILRRIASPPSSPPPSPPRAVRRCS